MKLVVYREKHCVNVSSRTWPKKKLKKKTTTNKEHSWMRVPCYQQTRSIILVVCPSTKTAVRSFIFVLNFVTFLSQYVAISHWWFYKRKKYFCSDFCIAVYDKTLKGNWELPKVFFVFENSCIICPSTSPV